MKFLLAIEFSAVYRGWTLLKHDFQGEPLDKILKSLKEHLPEGFEDMTPALKMHHLVQAGNAAFNLPGDWVLIDSSMTIAQMLQGSKS